jgi:thiol-disulfide isomerase/thioredoxin
MVIARRILLAAAGTVAAGGVAGKLLAARDEGQHPFRDFSNLMPTDPPKPLPAFSWKDADGKSHAMAEYAGQGVLLNCWATWCVPCVTEMPALNAAAPKYAAEKIVVLPLSSDHGGVPAVQAYFKAHDITNLPVLLDPDGAVEHALEMRGIPTTLIIDRQGKERARFEGAADWASDAVMAKVKALVG